MALDINNLLPQFEQAISDLGLEYLAAPGLILTEDDLKCLLYKKLTCMPEFSEPVPTQDRHIRGTPVHAEVSWYGEKRMLCIKPDITIVEPENVSILHGYVPNHGARMNIFRRPLNERMPHQTPPLPSKQFEF